MTHIETILQNRYRITAQLGQGGMGTVYKAVDQRLSLTVAIKETLADTEDLRRAFEKEAQLLANLNHPSLPRVSDHFIEDKGQYLVMDFVPNDDLGTMLSKRGRPFSIDDVMRWAKDLLEVLDYLHNHDPQILHRDIKPTNIKLSAKGKIILLDFGLAKGKAGEMTKATDSRSVYGYSLQYASLEQIQGDRTSERSDLYSLAATLYNLLTRTKPPDALTRATAVFNDEQDPLIPIQQLVSGLPNQVSETLMSAVALKPASRPKSAKEMLSKLSESYKSNPYAESKILTVKDETEIETQVKIQQPLTSVEKPKDVNEERSNYQPKNSPSLPNLQNIIHKINQPVISPFVPQKAPASEVVARSDTSIRHITEDDAFWNLRVLTYSVVGTHYLSPIKNTKLLVKYLNSKLPNDRKIIRFNTVTNRHKRIKFFTKLSKFTFSVEKPINKEDFLKSFKLDKASTKTNSILTSNSTTTINSIYLRVSEKIKEWTMLALQLLIGCGMLMSLFGVASAALIFIIDIIKPYPNKAQSNLELLGYGLLSSFSLTFILLLGFVLDDKIGLFDYKIGGIDKSRPAKIPIDSRSMMYAMLMLLFPILGLIAYLPFESPTKIESKSGTELSNLTSNKSVGNSINKLVNEKKLNPSTSAQNKIQLQQSVNQYIQEVEKVTGNENGKRKMISGDIDADKDEDVVIHTTFQVNNTGELKAEIILLFINDNGYYRGVAYKGVGGTYSGKFNLEKIANKKIYGTLISCIESTPIEQCTGANKTKSQTNQYRYVDGKLTE
jgi:serine/threonine protein kinase